MSIAKSNIEIWFYALEKNTVHSFSHLSLELFKFQKNYPFDKYDAHVHFKIFNLIYLKDLFYIVLRFSLAYTFLLLFNRNRRQTFITRPHHVHYYVFLFSLSFLSPRYRYLQCAIIQELRNVLHIFLDNFVSEHCQFNHWWLIEQHVQVHHGLILEILVLLLFISFHQVSRKYQIVFATQQHSIEKRHTRRTSTWTSKTNRPHILLN